MADTQSLARSREQELDEILRDLSGAGLYRNNVFRLTGLPVTASASQIRRGREEAALLAQLGTPPAAAGELPLTPAPGWDTMNAAFESMRNPVLRLVHEMLWLWNVSTADEHDNAVRRHCGVLEGESLTAPGRPSVTDDPLAQQWIGALRIWAEVLASEEIWDHARQRVLDIDDPRLTTGTVRRLRDRLPRHIVDVHLAFAMRALTESGPLAADRHVWVLDDSEFDEGLVATALRDAVRPAEERVRAACEAADRVAASAPKEAVAAGHVVLEQTATPLWTITGMLGAEHPITQAVHDAVARSANLCAVAHDNLTEASTPALSLLPAARDLAREQTTIELIDRNLSIIARQFVTSKVAKLCEASRVDAAARRLRALRRHVEDVRLVEQIDAVLADPQALRSPARLPVRGMVLFVGAHLYGQRKVGERGRYVVTHYLTFLEIPLIALGAHLRDTGSFYGKVPLGRVARWWRPTALVLLAAVCTLPQATVSGLLSFVAVLAVIAAMIGVRWLRSDRWAARVVREEGEKTGG